MTAHTIFLFPGACVCDPDSQTVPLRLVGNPWLHGASIQALVTISFIDPVLSPAVAIRYEKSPGSIATVCVQKEVLCV